MAKAQQQHVTDTLKKGLADKRITTRSIVAFLIKIVMFSASVCVWFSHYFAIGSILRTTLAASLSKGRKRSIDK